MNVNKKNCYIAAIAVGIIGCLITWFFMGDSSPFKNLIPFLGSFWRLLHVHLYLVFLMFDPPSYLEDLVSYLLVFVQWFIVGRFGWWIIEKIRGKQKNLS